MNPMLETWCPPPVTDFFIGLPVATEPGLKQEGSCELSEVPILFL